jgi:hypothetical protein
MKQLPIIALILIAAYALQARSQAPNVYRCGNSYSQTPCPGGSPIDATDSRSSAQKAQSDAVIQRDKSTASSMEKSRLQEEEALRRKQPSAAPEQAVKTPGTERKVVQPVRHVRKYNQRNPDNFTAKAPSEKKKKIPATATTSP